MATARRELARYPSRVGERRVATPRRAGGGGVVELQRARMLQSAVQVVLEEGYGQMSVARVTGRAGVSRRTFYEVFKDREGCFLAAFDQTVAEMRILATSAWEHESSWQAQVRAALGVLLEYLDEQPGAGSLVVVEALGAGPKVLAKRAKVLAALATVVDQGRLQATKGSGPPPLTAEGLVGAVLGVIHSRLLESPRAPIVGLLNPLMGMIVAPYLGSRAAARELQHSGAPRSPAARAVAQGEPLRGLNMRVTHRTLLVLAVIAEQPGVSNRQVADGAGVSDQGQISKLLSRLESLGLIDNMTPLQPTGEANQWRLTDRGQEVQATIDTHTNPIDRIIPRSTR